MRRYLFILMLSGFTLNVYSQIADPVYQVQDSETVGSKHRFPADRANSYLIPVSTVLYGVMAQEFDPLQRVDKNLRSEIREDHPNFNAHIDDYLQYAPAASVYALGMLGVKGKNNVLDKSGIYFLSNAIQNISVGFLKTKTHKLRPDGSDYRSFPSGHTATAFAAAEFMSQEYKDVSPWIGIAAYATAASTGSIRMLNNKHWFSDVAMGAGVGILSTKLAYWVYPVIKQKITKNSKIAFIPVYNQGIYGFAMSASLP